MRIFTATGTSATQVNGNDSVDGSTWLSGLTADGGSHTLYVALLDHDKVMYWQWMIMDLVTRVEVPVHRVGTVVRRVQIADIKPRLVDTRVQTAYRFNYPDVSVLYSSDYNGMQVQWNYQSQSNDMQSLSWAYKLDEDFYGTSTSATQVDGNDSVDGSSWLSGLTYGGSHTLYVALLDQGSNVLANGQSWI